MFMKTILGLILISFSLNAAAAQMEIFSMNLHCALGDWKSRLETIIDEIILRNPHVIGFQEVCKNKQLDMADYILRELKKKNYQVKSFARAQTHRSFINYQEELLIITRMETKQKLEGNLTSLKFFENKYLGLKIADTWVITTHLHFALPSIRATQYHELNEEFNSSKAIIFGDMNSHPGNRETSVFKMSGWKAFFNGPTYPARNPDKIFDGFWMSKASADNLSSASMEILFSEEHEPPSDHLGVYLIMESI